MDTGWRPDQRSDGGVAYPAPEDQRDHVPPHIATRATPGAFSNGHPPFDQGCRRASPSRLGAVPDWGCGHEPNCAQLAQLVGLKSMNPNTTTTHELADPASGVRRHPTAQALIDAAVAEMDETGESSVHIQKVLDDSGVAYGSLYHHFENREDLVSQAIAERYIRSVNLGLGEFAQRALEVTTPESVRALLRFELSRIAEERLRVQRLVRLNALGSAIYRPHVLETIAVFQSAYFDQAAELLAVIQDRGLIHPTVKIRAFAAWYLSLILSRAFVEIDPLSDPSGDWSEYTFVAAITIIEHGI